MYNEVDFYINITAELAMDETEASKTRTIRVPVQYQSEPLQHTEPTDSLQMN